MKTSHISIAAIFFALTLGSAVAADKQKLTVATEGAYPPYNLVAADGTLKGFDVDFAKALCEKINADCTIVKQDWDGMIPALMAKKFDLIVASMGILPEREEKIDFSIPYYQAPTALVATKASGIKAGADGLVDGESLAGKKIGIQRATGYETFAKKNWPKAEYVLYDNSESANLDMTGGRLDARFDDAVLLKNGLMTTPTASDYAIVGKILSEKDMGSKGEGIGMRKGETDMKKAVDKAILDMRADGTYKKINDKYFDFDIYGQ